MSLRAFTINSAFAEDFYVFERRDVYYFVTQSGKLYIAPSLKGQEKSRTMKPLWDDAKRPIVAVIENAKEKALAREFVELLLSPDGQEALARFGFQPGTRG